MKKLIFCLLIIFSLASQGLSALPEGLNQKQYKEIGAAATEVLQKAFSKAIQMKIMGGSIESLLISQYGLKVEEKKGILTVSVFGYENDADLISELIAFSFLIAGSKVTDEAKTIHIPVKMDKKLYVFAADAQLFKKNTEELQGMIKNSDAFGLARIERVLAELVGLKK